MSIYSARAVFTFIPKNACTALRYSAAVANGVLPPGHTDIRWLHLNNTTFRPTLAEFAQAQFTFVVLRDPFARLASCFLDKIVGMSPIAWKFRPQDDPEGRPDEATFAQFVKRVSRMAAGGDDHWRPQSDFLVYRDYDRWYAIDDLATAAEELQARIGFALQDIPETRKHGRANLQRLEGNYAHVSAAEIGELKRRGAVPSIASLYDEETVATVRQAYADDLALFTARTGHALMF